MSRPAKSVHGEYGYARTKRCGCELCRKAVSRYDKLRRYEIHQGIERRLDATEARTHVQALVDAGLTYQQIAHATAGVVVHSQIRKLIEGNNGRPVQWLTSRTIEALLDVDYADAFKFNAYVPALGVHRRLQALRYMGYTVVDISRGLGISESAFYHYMQRDQLMLDTVRKVDALYRKWAMTPGGNERSRWHAYRNNYAPPMAWDDHNIDDPNATPDMASVACVIESCLRPVKVHGVCGPHLRAIKDRGGMVSSVKFREVALRIGRNRQIHDGSHIPQVLAELRELGVTREEAARRLGRSVSYVEKMWKETA